MWQSLGPSMALQIEYYSARKRNEIGSFLFLVCKWDLFIYFWLYWVFTAAHGLHKSEQGLFFIVDHQGSPGHSVSAVAVLGCGPQAPGGPSWLLGFCKVKAVLLITLPSFTVTRRHSWWESNGQWACWCHGVNQGSVTGPGYCHCVLSTTHSVKRRGKAKASFTWKCARWSRKMTNILCDENGKYA